VLKSRGMAHSNQIREFLLSDNGVDVIPVAIGANGVLTPGVSHKLSDQGAGRVLARPIAQRA
jgi:circadian clock protein KaiC